MISFDKGKTWTEESNTVITDQNGPLTRTDKYGHLSYSYNGGNTWGLKQVVISGGSNSSNANSRGFNSDAAANWLNNNAADSYLDASGACAKYIRQSLEAGFGLQKDALKGKAPVPARLYGPFLVKMGFQAVNTTNYQKGDIAVFDGIHGSKADPKTGIPYGHIQMFDGNKWISDFQQENPFWPSHKYEKERPHYQIYRLGN